MLKPLYSSLVYLVQTYGIYYEEPILYSVMLLDYYGDWLREAKSPDEFCW